MLVKLLENLIRKKYYDNKETIETKLNVFYAMSKITDEEYSDLTLKVEEVYTVIGVVENAETTEENTVESEE